jgi:hypothetical protein
MAIDFHAKTEKEWEAVFSVWSMPRLYDEDQYDKLVRYE